MGRKVLVAGAGAACKLNNEAFAHEVGAICETSGKSQRRRNCMAGLRTESYRRVSTEQM
jgi:hypothetical protein